MGLIEYWFYKLCWDGKKTGRDGQTLVRKTSAQQQQ